ncbi:hypothetical protein [Leptolyngbya sp. 7M]|uniref:hypothetical protein n=1 Tax=Leptolyngbya sp. 7M TaxID=2812896 RepID=UPI001B8D84E8|nr:hypothetical protein [Leptolyngbya sp. 7M]QYO68201.1 hypothetical protein JVX88_16410 [Leptolyngbya sp. 7M]
MAQTIYYIQVEGAKIAWRADDSKYKGILSTIGAKKAGKNEKGLVFGVNQPRLPRLRINYKDGDGAKIFCSPDKTKDCTFGNKLRGKKSNGKTIESASFIGVRT